ncbi:MAG: hypothetical protein K9L32_04140 [Chromatiaceae bacterium]|nr:hypothetical protein [Chromatiaceae bacterium]MCF8003392.1 hypothetical protein [Chromatiaceae bacterium]
MKMNEFTGMIKKIFRNLRDLNKIEQTVIQSEIERIRRAYITNSKSLIPYGRKSYSQNDEDGIIEEIFDRIGYTNKKFIEIGIGDGLENNTLALLIGGWSGLWVDMNYRSINKIIATWRSLIDQKKLIAVASKVNIKNINKIIFDSGVFGEIDLLSIDIDGNEIYVLDAIQGVSPRCIVVEYNAKLGPKLEYCMPYSEEHMWDGSDDFGSSLKYLEIFMASRNYSLVGCNITGANAFFVRSDLLQDSFISPYTSEVHYQPPRYYLSGYASGHPASFKSISRILTKQI